MGEFKLSFPSLLMIALGGLGIYLVLPRGTRSTNPLVRWIGCVLATISLVLIAANFGNFLPNKTNELTFYLLAAVSIASAALMIASHNPIISALWFALVLLSNSGLYLLQGAEFLSAATIIIYAGAIIVTFLFVIMLAQPNGAAPYDLHSREPLLSCTAGVILAWTLLGTLHHSSNFEALPFNARQAGASSAAVPSQNLVAKSLAAHPESIIRSERPHVDSLGRTLFLEHYVSIEVVGMLLLVAVVGALLIATRQGEPLGSGQLTKA